MHRVARATRAVTRTLCQGLQYCNIPACVHVSEPIAWASAANQLTSVCTKYGQCPKGQLVIACIYTAIIAIVRAWQSFCQNARCCAFGHVHAHSDTCRGTLICIRLGSWRRGPWLGVCGMGLAAAACKTSTPARSYCLPTLARLNTIILNTVAPTPRVMKHSKRLTAAVRNVHSLLFAAGISSCAHIPLTWHAGTLQLILERLGNLERLGKQIEEALPVKLTPRAAAAVKGSLFLIYDDQTIHQVRRGLRSCLAMQALPNTACRIRKRARMQYLRRPGRRIRPCMLCTRADVHCKQLLACTCACTACLACCPAGPQEAQADHERPHCA